MTPGNDPPCLWTLVAAPAEDRANAQSWQRGVGSSGAHEPCHWEGVGARAGAWAPEFHRCHGSGVGLGALARFPGLGTPYWLWVLAALTLAGSLAAAAPVPSAGLRFGILYSCCYCCCCCSSFSSSCSSSSLFSSLSLKSAIVDGFWSLRCPNYCIDVPPSP